MSEQNAKRDWSKVNRRASRIVNLRLTPEEEAEIESRAAGEQTTLSHYLKAAALSQPVTRRVSRRQSTADVELLRSIHADLGRIAGNSYQIVRAMNFGRNVPDEEATAILKDIRAALVRTREQLFTALEREP
ncbi:plasmid mobilization protein [Microcoleus sp. B7-D4]|uniref:plasmid mobilization protein n=1 Tax=Microcoleus sp. B7-D4 TaxID=2818696 RepID=UPI002FD5492D